jgi:hypothetical protein
VENIPDWLTLLVLAATNVATLAGGAAILWWRQQRTEKDVEGADADAAKHEDEDRKAHDDLGKRIDAARVDLERRIVIVEGDIRVIKHDAANTAQTTSTRLTLIEGEMKQIARSTTRIEAILEAQASEGTGPHPRKR